MSNDKMREALEQIASLCEIPFANTQGDSEIIYQIARESLAQREAQEPVAILSEAEQTELLDWVSACQSAYRMETVRQGPFFSLPGQLKENRESLVAYVNSILESRTSPPPAQVQDDIAKDAERYRWLKAQMVGASFNWDDEGMTVLAFQMPDGIALGSDCDKNIDAARAILAKQEGES